MNGFGGAASKLREDQADAAKQRWAVAQRAVVEATAAVEAARARLDAGRASLAASMGGRHEDGAPSPRAASAPGGRWTPRGRDRGSPPRPRPRAQGHADERRREYDQAARRVKALSRLEDRWKRERTARRRRADARIQDEFVARLARGRNGDDHDHEGPDRASISTSERSPRATHDLDRHHLQVRGLRPRRRRAPDRLLRHHLRAHRNAGERDGGSSVAFPSVTPEETTARNARR